jgi:hypothetical protein
MTRVYVRLEKLASTSLARALAHIDFSTQPRSSSSANRSPSRSAESGRCVCESPVCGSTRLLQSTTFVSLFLARSPHRCSSKARQRELLCALKISKMSDDFPVGYRAITHKHFEGTTAWRHPKNHMAVLASHLVSRSQATEHGSLSTAYPLCVACSHTCCNMTRMRSLLLFVALSCFVITIASDAKVGTRIAVGIIGAIAYVWREHGTSKQTNVS